jgi:hypothetical protein
MVETQVMVVDYKNIFVTNTVIVIIVNLIYVYINPTLINNITLSSLVGFVSGVAIIGLIIGIQISVVGSGISLSDQSIKMFITIGMLLNIMFSVDIWTFQFGQNEYTAQIGLGLINNFIDIFSGGDFMGLGLALASIISILMFISGVMMVVE